MEHTAWPLIYEQALASCVHPSHLHIQWIQLMNALAWFLIQFSVFLSPSLRLPFRSAAISALLCFLRNYLWTVGGYVCACCITIPQMDQMVHTIFMVRITFKHAPPMLLAVDDHFPRRVHSLGDTLIQIADEKKAIHKHSDPRRENELSHDFVGMTHECDADMSARRNVKHISGICAGRVSM